MRGFVLMLVIAVVVMCAGCGKRVSTAHDKPAPSDAGFAENNPENTLSWLAAQRTALYKADDKDYGDKFKAVVDSLKGQSIAWTGSLERPNSDGTCGLIPFALATTPESRNNENREWHFVIVCKPFDSSARIKETPKFERKIDPGFTLANWQGKPRVGTAVKLTGNIAAVQLQERSWVTGYQIQDRVVHTEIGITLHLANAAVTPQ